eukprot:4009896-Heterocapsa_arctica.AAC.1
MGRGLDDEVNVGKKSTPPPSGGGTQNSTTKATPAVNRDKTLTLSDSDRCALMTTIMGINSGTRIDFGEKNNLKDDKLLN